MKTFASPKSAQEIFRFLSSSTHTPQEIHEITGIPPRTIRFALNLLKKRKLIIQKKSLKDMRKTYCTIRKDINDIQRKRWK